MKLHKYPSEFKMLIPIVAEYMHLPETAIERDYYIVLLLKNLANSEFAGQCVFKGGIKLGYKIPTFTDNILKLSAHNQRYCRFTTCA